MTPSELPNGAPTAGVLDPSSNPRFARPMNEGSPDPFKRVTFAIDDKNFTEYVGHQPTPEPLEHLYDTTTLRRLFGLTNPDGTSKRLFVWHSWMWMPAALLVATAFMVGGYLALTARKQVIPRITVPMGATSLVVGRNPSRTSAVPNFPAVTAPAASSRAVPVSEDPARPSSSPIPSGATASSAIASGTIPSNAAPKRVTISATKSAKRMAPKPQPSATPSDGANASPFATSPFTRAD